MPGEQTLADYLDGALPEDEGSVVEETLVHEPAFLREVVAQERMDAALRALLGGAADHERIKQGIMADISAGSMSQTKRRVLVDMAAYEKKRRARKLEWRIAALSLAAAVVLIGGLTWWQSRRTRQEIAQREEPTPVENKIVPEPQQKITPVPAPVIVVVPPKIEPVPQPDNKPLVTQDTGSSPMKSPVPTPPTPEKPVLPVAPVPVAPPPPKPVTPVVVVAAPRDFIEWPFASDSPWNQPIGSYAKYVGVRFAVREKFDPQKIGIRIRPVLRSAPNGTAQRVTAGGEDFGSFNLVIPPDQFNGNDQPVSILDRNTTSVLELRDAVFTQPGVISAKFASLVDLRGSGFTGGVAESGSSAFGGVIQAGETVNGIHHALAMAVNIQWLSLKSGKLYVWPATSAAYPPKSFVKPGNVQFGTLLAIPQTVSIEKLNVGANGTPGYEIAKALQNYGAYVTESCRWQQFHFYFSDGSAPANITEIFSKLAKELHVVTNNTPASPGGGGKPLVPLAPALPPK